MKSLGLRFSYPLTGSDVTDDEINDVHARIITADR